MKKNKKQRNKSLKRKPESKRRKRIEKEDCAAMERDLI